MTSNQPGNPPQPGQQSAQPQPAQSQQPAQPQQPAPAPQQKKSGGGCMKGCLGCGCLSIVAMGLIAMLAGGYLWWQGPELMESVSESVAVLGDSGKSLGRGGGGGGGGGMDLSSLGGGSGSGNSDSLEQMLAGTDGDSSNSQAQETQRNRIESSERFFDSLDTPMTKREIAGVASSLDEWEESRTVTRFNDLLAKGEELGDDDSLMANARKIRLAIGLVFRVKEIGEEFPKHIEQSGGDEFLNDYQQLLAIHGASKVGATGDHEPWEQAVADALIEDHDEHRDAFDQNRALLRESQGEAIDISQLSEQEQSELMEAFATQFSYLPSAISRDSLESWAALSDEERKNITEHFSSPQAYLSRTIGMINMENASQELIFFNAMGL